MQHWPKITALLLLIITALWLWLWRGARPVAPLPDTAAKAHAQPARSTPPETTQQASPPKTASSPSTTQLPATALPAENSPGAAAAAGVYAWEVGRSAPSDARFYELAQLLRQDPDFFDALKAQFQTELDPKRLERLAFLLGEIDHPSLTPLAASMLSSGNSESEIAALSLLSRTQARDHTAHKLILQTIDTRDTKALLVPALNALARAQSDATDEQRRAVVNRVAPLTQHAQANVRRHSYVMLFRWAANDQQVQAQLLAGLSDPDPNVRRSTAFGFVDYPRIDDAVKRALFTMLNDATESAQNRRAAASALNRIRLSAGEQAHIDAQLSALPRR